MSTSTRDELIELIDVVLMKIRGDKMEASLEVIKSDVTDMKVSVSTSQKRLDGQPKLTEEALGPGTRLNF